MVKHKLYRRDSAFLIEQHLYCQSQSNRVLGLASPLSDSKQRLSSFSLYNSAMLGVVKPHPGERQARNLCPPTDALDRFFDGVAVCGMFCSNIFFRLRILSLCGTLFLHDDGGGDQILLRVA